MWKRIGPIAALLLLALAPMAQAQGTPMPDVRIQFFDNNGLPCSGCLLNAYAAGTSTRQATFSNIDLADPGHKNANPVVMDSAGRPSTGYIYLSATTYRFVLTDSTGATQYWEADNTPAVPSTSSGLDLANQTAGEALNAGDVVYLSGGSGGKTAGRWYKADSANDYSSSTASMVGIVPTAIASTAIGSIRIAGRATGLAGLSTGSTYWVGTAGALTATVPTNARKVGGADTTSTLDFSNQDYASVLERTFRVDATTPYSWTLPAADANGLLSSNGTGTVALTPFPLSIAEGRLTGTTVTPVTTADVSGVTSIFYTPYIGSRIALYSGTVWAIRSFTEITISVTACTASKPYDVFIVDAGAGIQPTAEILVWTNTTTRATALALQDGVLVKSGATTRRYVGSFFCNSSGGQTDDSLAKRFIWNYYNRRARRLARQDNSGWTYSTATLRQAKASTANQVEAITGYAEEEVSLTLTVSVVNDNAATLNINIGIGLDSTTVSSSLGSNYDQTTVSKAVVLNAVYAAFPGIGYHFYTWLESGGGTGTTTWVGRNNNGLEGWVLG